MITTIIKYKLYQSYNTFARSSVLKKLGWLIPIAFITPYYIVTIRTMSHIYYDVYAMYGWIPMVRLVNANLAVVFFFVTVSTASLTLYKLFQAKDLLLLMSLPARDRSLFVAKILDSMEDAIRNMILPFPVCIAFASVIVKTGSLLSAIIFFIGWIGILIQLASISIIIALLLGRLFIARAALLRIISIISILIFLSIFMSYFQKADSDLSLSPSARFAPIAMVFPTSWLIGSLPYGGSNVMVFLCGSAFVLETIACLTVAALVFKLRFRLMWMKIMEVSPRKKSQHLRIRPVRQLGNTHAFIIKEMHTIAREPNILISLIIPIVFFSVISFIKKQSAEIQAFYILFVSLMTTATFTMPCVGREGRTFALLKTLPVKISVILKAKFFLSCIANFLVTFIFTIALYIIQNLNADQLLRNILISIIAAVYLSSFGIALAALFPRFDFTSPMKAVSAHGIFVFYLIAALFAGTMAWTVSTGWRFVSLILIIWAVIAGALLKIGQTKLEKMEV